MEPDYASEYMAIKSHLIALKRYQGQVEDQPEPPDALAVLTMLLIAILILVLSGI